MGAEVADAESVKALQLLHRAEQMELFLQKRFATHKRYSGEGSEALVVALNALISEASKESGEHPGIDSAILGMPHRGRLATLVVLNSYPMRNLLHKVAGNNDMPVELNDRIDDIPTHIAVSNTAKYSTATGSLTSANRKVTLSMVHNPSHLESQNAISMGKARAKIDDSGSSDTRSVLNIQAHGDAAFCGQGAAYEGLTLSKLPKFDVGGSVHIITNNQVGFTTSAEDGRSFDHSSDIVKCFGIPVVRINAMDGDTTPESLIRVCKFMIAYWKTFKKDILIDMIGCRKHGHNEVDEPAFTQPHMYEKIRAMKSLAS
jgi:probable 2-oxoglutarate dehydrogenase E1 component DHKTD1